MYNVYNPNTGENVKFESLDEAKSLISKIINDFIVDRKVVVNVIDVKDNGDETWIPNPSLNVGVDALQLIGQDPSITNEQKLAWILEERDNRLAASDWTQLSDVVALHDEAWVNSWKVYRQALRDLPLTLDINNPTYPVPPL